MVNDPFIEEGISDAINIPSYLDKPFSGSHSFEPNFW